MIEGLLKLREADLSDCKLLFKWANDPIVRENALDTNVIHWENHQRWFQAKLLSSYTHILILENDQNLGQIRFDKYPDEDIWQIDYSIESRFRGLGLGKELIRKGLIFMKQHYPNAIIVAKVKTVNIPSIKIFAQLGFDSKRINGLIEFSLPPRMESFNI